MPPPNAIIVVLDRLGAGYLGPYGNTWIDTPTWNRLASESLLWENALADEPTLAGFYRAVGWIRHAWCDPPPAVPDPNHIAIVGAATSRPPTWIEQCAASGVQTSLVTDEPQLAAMPVASGFGEYTLVRAPAVTHSAESLDATRMGQCFAAALACLEQLHPPFLLWLHVRALSDVWDAPLELRRSLADEEDPVPPDLMDPPDRHLGADPDPDEILGITQAYGGQVMAADTCLGTLLQAIESASWARDTLLIVTSPRGFPLGERGAIGPSGDSLHEEVLHLPLVIRHPNPNLAMERIPALVQPADLAMTLANWFQITPAEAPLASADLLQQANQPWSTVRPGVASTFAQEKSLRTAAWFLRQIGEEAAELYVKPDDRWEVNEVAARCGAGLEEGQRYLRDLESWLRGNCAGSPPAVPRVLLEPPD